MCTINKTSVWGEMALTFNLQSKSRWQGPQGILNLATLIFNFNFLMLFSFIVRDTSIKLGFIFLSTFMRSEEFVRLFLHLL